MNYPGGRKYIPRTAAHSSTSINYANRGMALETIVEWMNQAYERNKIAAIEKIPTGVKVFRAEGSRIKDGVFIKHGTVDYTGTYKGRAIWFDAKSTISKTSFPMDNLDSNQMDRLIIHHQNQAICFLLVHFDKLQRAFLLPFELLEHYWNRRQVGIRGTNSIPLSIFEEQAYEVMKSTMGPLDYLASVDQYIHRTSTEGGLR